jgi:hypothetical protein
MSMRMPPNIPTPLTGAAVFNRLKDLHRRIVLDLQAEGKTEDWVPAWYVHLPSGEKVRIKLIEKEGPLIRFTRPEGSYVIVAPTAVAITIEPLPEDAEGFPVEFLEADESVEDDGSE